MSSQAQTQRQIFYFGEGLQGFHTIKTRSGHDVGETLLVLNNPPAMHLKTRLGIIVREFLSATQKPNIRL
jgi:hypothetical protein